ncbi:MAG: hypothetical protein AABX11_05485 [Nanoarchaeota archaeon]
MIKVLAIDNPRALDLIASNLEGPDFSGIPKEITYQEKHNHSNRLPLDYQFYLLHTSLVGIKDIKHLRESLPSAFIFLRNTLYPHSRFEGLGNICNKWYDFALIKKRFIEYLSQGSRQ